MSKPIVQSAAADSDVVSIVAHIADDNLMAALALADALDITKQRISDFPELGERFLEAKLPELRRILVDKFSSYSVYYQVLSDEVQIVRVIHNSRDIDSALATPSE